MVAPYSTVSVFTVRTRSPVATISPHELIPQPMYKLSYDWLPLRYVVLRIVEFVVPTPGGENFSLTEISSSSKFVIELNGINIRINAMIIVDAFKPAELKFCIMHTTSR